MAINFQLPGPKIQVCKDDVIVVDLYNNAEGSSTSLHWHGLRQFGTQFSKFFDAKFLFAEV